jgi:catechol-2,3-dioxygenase
LQNRRRAALKQPEVSAPHWFNHGCPVTWETVMPSPIRLAHLVLKSADVAASRSWYCNVLEGRVAFEKLPDVSLVTYDEEHHRLGIVAAPDPAHAPDPRQPGLLHIAFTYADIRELLRVYRRLRDQGMRPVFTVNHGPTVSFYYSDPDGNGVELQVDRFATAAQAQQFIDEVFDRNPVGIACDPDDLLRRMDAGESDEQLMHYDRGAAPLAQPFV